MATKHLERRGYKPNLDMLPLQGRHRINGSIEGRRARKVWPCTSEDCSLPEIEWDEMYVEVLDPQGYRGPHRVPPVKRFHLSCAFRLGFIVKEGVEKINRRGAVEMTRAKHE